ncbi:hypothetical protein [Leptolyngbya ohadii]|uniref:hypothetical protein n=1 Tax=Leptolyngbya ohadii TaxID=1962290 RepID=UPI000B59EBA0|nr:hypothetical protein [Leptolyngbya ohadii]
MVLSRSGLAGLALLAGLPAVALPPPRLEIPIEIAQEVTQKVGQVNPNRPIRIEITNAGQLDLEFALTQPVSAQRRLPAGGEIAFGSTSTSFLPPPVYLMAYPEESEIAVNMYVLSTDRNVVEVVVGQQAGILPGGRTLTIDSDGSVYVF